MTWINNAGQHYVSFVKTCSPIRLEHKRSGHVRGHLVWPHPELQPLGSVLTDPSQEPDSHFTLYKSTHHHVPNPPVNLAVTWTEGACALVIAVTPEQSVKCQAREVFFIWLLDHVKSTGAKLHRQQWPCMWPWRREKEMQSKVARACKGVKTLDPATEALRQEKSLVLRLSWQMKLIVRRLNSSSQMQWSEINSVTQGIIDEPWLTCFCVKACLLL